MATLSCHHAMWILLLSVTLTAGESCEEYDEIKHQIDQHRGLVKTLKESVLKSKRVLKDTRDFVEKFPKRVTGSREMESAIDYVHKSLLRENIKRTWKETVPVMPVSGSDEAWLAAPFRMPLSVVSIKGTGATDPFGITKQVVVFTYMTQFEGSEREISDKIVVFMPQYKNGSSPPRLRKSVIEKAKHMKAAGVLIRSPIQQGLMASETSTIPCGAIPVEHAFIILQEYKKNPYGVYIHLNLNSQDNQEMNSSNIVAELQGSDKTTTDHIVLMTSALDNFPRSHLVPDLVEGLFVTWHSLILLKNMGYTPRRTIRAVFLTGSKQGGIGAEYYRKKMELKKADKVDAIMETEMGSFSPTGLRVRGHFKQRCIAQFIVGLLSDLGLTGVEESHDIGSDILKGVGPEIPSFGLNMEYMDEYWFRHYRGLDPVPRSPDGMEKSTIVWAATAFILANISSSE